MHASDRDSAGERKIVTDDRGQDQPQNKPSAQKMGAPTERADAKRPAKKITPRPGPPR